MTEKCENGLQESSHAWIYPNINQAALSAPRLWGSSPSNPPQVYELCSWLFVLDPLRFFSPVLDSPPTPGLCRACSLGHWETWTVRKSGPNSSKDEYTDVSFTLNPIHLSITVSVQCEHVSTGTGKWADTLYSQHQAQARVLWQVRLRLAFPCCHWLKYKEAILEKSNQRVTLVYLVFLFWWPDLPSEDEQGNWKEMEQLQLWAGQSDPSRQSPPV